MNPEKPQVAQTKKPLTEIPPSTQEEFYSKSPTEARQIEERRKVEQMALETMEQEIERVRLEIEEHEKKKTNNALKEASVSRRDFIRNTLAGVLTVGAVGELLSYASESKNKNKMIKAKSSKGGGVSYLETKGKKIEEEIARCEEIIKNNNFEAVLNNPYLVSALYYSEPAIKKMGLPKQSGPEKIIWNTHHFITKDFRLNYINFLKKTVEQKKMGQPENSDKQSLPVDTLNWKGAQDNHPDAIDLFVAEGMPVHSMTDGLVVLAQNGWQEDDELSTSSTRGGNSVIIFNPRNMSFYRYAHMEEVQVSVGIVLSSADPIGIVGHTGINASKKGHGNHVHFEINTYDEKKGVMLSKNVSELQRELRKTEKSK